MFLQISQNKRNRLLYEQQSPPFDDLQKHTMQVSA